MKKLEKKIAVIGCGNIGSAIARGLTKSGLVDCKEMILTRRHANSLASFEKQGFHVTRDNRQAVEISDIVIISVTPQQLDALLEEIGDALDAKKHTVMTVVSGASIQQIKKNIGKEIPVVRVMPNTAIAIGESMTCLSAHDQDKTSLDDAEKLFSGLGKTIVIHEDLMVPATALCACGIAFFLRSIRAASQGGIEIGFNAEDALYMAAQTAKGAAALLVDQGPQEHPEREVDKVTTPQGCTISGLNQMEHHGFSSSMIHGIVTSAEKAAKLYAGDNDDS
jgi:pyrroline-5-carboxylate reductase